MRQLVILAIAISMAGSIFLTSCGSSKPTSVSSNPSATRVKREVSQVDLLVSQQTSKLRVAGIGTSYQEMRARSEALNMGNVMMASMLSTAVAQVVEDYRKENNINIRSQEETVTEGLTKTVVSELVRTRQIGLPDVYDRADGQIEVHICLELVDDTDAVIDRAYEKLTRKEVIGTDLDRDKFREKTKTLLDGLLVNAMEK